MPQHTTNSRVIEQYTYAWFIPLASFFIHFLSDGFTNSFGVYLPVMVDHFASTRAKCSLIGSLLPAFTYLSGPIGAWLVGRVGCRSTALIGSILCFVGIVISSMATSIAFLCLSIGLVTAVGFGLAYVPAITAINISFERRCATAMGIATSGSGVGTLIFSVLTGTLLRSYDLPGALLVSSAILANMIPISLVFSLVKDLRPNVLQNHDSACQVSEEQNNNSQAASSTWTRSKTLLTYYPFLMFMISNFLTSLGFNAPYIFMVDYARLNGIIAHKAEMLIAIMGLANIAGRLIIGHLGDRFKGKMLLLYITCLTVSGIASMLEGFSDSNYWAHAIYAFVFGFFSGGYVCLTSPTAESLIGKELIADAFGLVLFVQGLATLIGPPISGSLYDWTESYRVPFLTFGSAILISGLMLLFARRGSNAQNYSSPQQADL